MSRKTNPRHRPGKEAAATPGAAQLRFPKIPAGWLASGVCVFLAVMTWAIFWRTTLYDFIPYDDNAYVYENPEVTRGLSLNTVRWAFTHSDLGLWTPLTTISHMIDCQIYKLDPWGHHLTNVLLHIATAVALFVVLWQMTGALWRSAFVAAVFAIHPLRVESVAWVAERKDVLSGLLFMLTLGAYVFYVRRRSAWRYLAVALFFALGIMAKQMVVTLPCVLLLLDYWPLKRFGQPPNAGAGSPGGVPIFARLAIEKLPLFALSAASSIQSMLGRKPEPGTTAQGLQHVSFLRIENALVSYVVYIGKFFRPVNLSVFYPYPASVPAWQALGALALLAGASVAIFAWRRSHPEFVTGWFWYLGMLVPVIGFVPLGKEAHADRYTYLPEIGLCIMVAWGVDSLAASWPRRREILALAAALALSLLARLAVAQASYWSDGVTLWRHAITCVPDNAYTRNFLGFALYNTGRYDEAGSEYEKAIALKPDYAEPENNLGLVLFQEGDVDGAIRHFNRAIEIDEGHAEARCNLGLALIKKGLFDDAITQLRMVTAFRPNRVDGHDDLGLALLDKGEVDGAIAEFSRALQIKPDDVNAHVNLGNAFLQKDEPSLAVANYQKALGIAPQNIQVQLNLAHVLATSTDGSVRDGKKAVDLAQQANDLTGGNEPGVLDTLAAAFAEAGRFPEAIETARRAQEIATQNGQAKLAGELQQHLALYRANTPLRQPPPQPAGK